MCQDGEELAHILAEPVVVQNLSPSDNDHQSYYLETDAQDAAWHIDLAGMQYEIGSVQMRGDDDWAVVAAGVEHDK